MIVFEVGLIFRQPCDPLNGHWSTAEHRILIIVFMWRIVFMCIEIRQPMAVFSLRTAGIRRFESVMIAQPFLGRAFWIATWS
jgi:hypothetical protein